MLQTQAVAGAIILGLINLTGREAALQKFKVCTITIRLAVATGRVTIAPHQQYYTPHYYCPESYHP